MFLARNDSQLKQMTSPTHKRRGAEERLQAPRNPSKLRKFASTKHSSPTFKAQFNYSNTEYNISSFCREASKAVMVSETVSPQPLPRRSSLTLTKSTRNNPPASPGRRSSLRSLFKQTKSTSSESILSPSNPTSNVPRQSRPSLDFLKNAAGKSSASLRSIFSNQDSSSSITNAKKPTSVDDLDVSLFKLYKGSTSLPLHRRRGDLRRDSFELLVIENPDLLDGSHYRPREKTTDEVAMAIRNASYDDEVEHEEHNK